MDSTGAATAVRLAALGGLASGLALAPVAAGQAAAPPAIIGAAAALGLGIVRPARLRGPAAAAWLLLLAISSATLGFGCGLVRLASIDAGAASLDGGARASISGHLTAAPTRSAGRLRLRVETPDGRLLVDTPDAGLDLAPGDGVQATGIAREPLPWERAYLSRLGYRAVLSAPEVTRLDAPRRGLAGWLDTVRSRAEAALGTGTGEAPASLLRGFVLGQDDRIAAETVEDFRRSGLAHLLAVSGTNVMLLSLLAFAVLGLLGVPLRPRLLCVLVLIAIYVPVAGAGPSIQRAGVMGAVGVIAVLASRPRSRGFALLLAAAATLAFNPRASGDVGWQLSFAAVAGIVLWTGRLRDLLQGPEPERRSPVRRALAEGAGLTIAATVATAPLMAHHFDAFPITSLPANLLALPAVAPVMWLGMAAGAAGQVPGAPVEPITAAAGAVAAYIAQVAEWMGAPRWALLELELPTLTEVATAYALLGGVVTIALRWSQRRRALRPARAPLAIALLAAAVGSLAVAPAAARLLTGPPAPAPPELGELAVTLLDVGQGDAILLEPGDGDAILVDAGPPGAGAAARVRELGRDRLGALVVTHTDTDHAGGAAEVLSGVPTAYLGQANPDPALVAVARATGARPRELTAGGTMRSGSLRLDVLWPPSGLLESVLADDEPNRLSVVLRARFRGFTMLLTGDAEAEVAAIDPGPIDVLKVAHHGSEDAGLASLVMRSRPELGVISAGAGNPFGHPDETTLDTLADEGVAILRTDTGGELRIEADRRGWRATASR